MPLPSPASVCLTTPEVPIAAALLELAQHYGFYSGLYVHLGHGRGERTAAPVRFAASSAVAERQFVGRFPYSGIARRAVSAHRAFAWSSDEEVVGILDRKHAGLAIPVQDYAAGPAVVALVGTDLERARDAADDQAAALMLAAVDLHVRALIALAPAANRDKALTQREIAVLRLVALGWSYPRCGAALGISEHTVEYHLKNVCEKLGAANKVHAVAIAVSEGWIDLS